MVDAESITVTISSEAARTIRALAAEHGYEPMDLIRSGIGVIPIFLRAKTSGHRVVVVDAGDQAVTELVLPEPKGVEQPFVDETALTILENAFPSKSLSDSIADLDPDKPKRKRETDCPPGQAR